jgi:hypothetical protein
MRAHDMEFNQERSDTQGKQNERSSKAINHIEKIGRENSSSGFKESTAKKEQKMPFHPYVSLKCMEKIIQNFPKA